MTLVIRTALHSDLRSIVALLRDDAMGATREAKPDDGIEAYEIAFQAINEQPGNSVLVATSADTIVGVLQLTIIPGLARLGMKRAQIEGVRVSSAQRNQRIGEELIARAIELARNAGCGLVQLTTDKSRLDAHRFYERLGFSATHEGMKLVFDRGAT